MSTQVGPAVKVNRVPVTFRLSPSRRDWLDSIVEHHHTDLAVVLRAALATAAAHPEEFAQKIDEAR